MSLVFGFWILRSNLAESCFWFCSVKLFSQPYLSIRSYCFWFWFVKKKIAPSFPNKSREIRFPSEVHSHIPEEQTASELPSAFIRQCMVEYKDEYQTRLCSLREEVLSLVTKEIGKVKANEERLHVVVGATAHRLEQEVPLLYFRAVGLWLCISLWLGDRKLLKTRTRA